MVIRGRLERSNWASDDSGEFCILGWRKLEESFGGRNNTTIAMYGYFSTTSRIMRISLSRFCAHTSRIRDIPVRFVGVVSSCADR